MKLLQQWKEEEKARERLLVVALPEEQAAHRYAEQKRLFGRYDAELDQSAYGPTWLIQPDIASIVSNSLQARDGQEYDLTAFTIMPNHVHVVLSPMCMEEGEYVSLIRIMHGLKRKTAFDANYVLGRHGAFWQSESYDHYVRDDGELERIVRYVLNNPVKAGLVESWDEWPWTYWKCRP